MQHCSERALWPLQAIPPTPGMGPSPAIGVMTRHRDRFIQETTWLQVHKGPLQLCIWALTAAHAATAEPICSCSAELQVRLPRLGAALPPALLVDLQKMQKLCFGHVHTCTACQARGEITVATARSRGMPCQPRMTRQKASERGLQARYIKEGYVIGQSDPAFCSCSCSRSPAV